MPVLPTSSSLSFPLSIQTPGRMIIEYCLKRSTSLRSLLHSPEWFSVHRCLPMFNGAPDPSLVCSFEHSRPPFILSTLLPMPLLSCLTSACRNASGLSLEFFSHSVFFPHEMSLTWWSSHMWSWLALNVQLYSLESNFDCPWAAEPSRAQVKVEMFLSKTSFYCPHHLTKSHLHLPASLCKKTPIQSKAKMQTVPSTKSSTRG